MTGIIDRLSNALPHLPNKMASAARYALDNPDRIAIASMRAVASECGVTSPTMLRLARQIGFDSYETFKAEFQNAVIGEGFRSRAGALRSVGGFKGQVSLMTQICEAATTNVSRSFSEMDPAELTKMVKMLLGAKTTYVLGAGSAHCVAALMQSTGRMALPGLRVPRSGDASLIEMLGAIGPDDAVLALAISPYAQSTVDALRFARERQVPTMVITDKRSSPLLEFADSRLFARTESPHYYPSIVALVAVVETLLANVVARSDQSTLDRIKYIETLRDRSGAYLK